MVRTRKSIGLRLADVALWMTAMIGTLLIALTAWATVSGVRPMVIMSGSMEPAIHTGSVVFVEQVDHRRLEKGDVVSVQSLSGATIVHRIVGIEREAGKSSLTLKGDANDTVDEDLVVVTDAMRVRGVVPGAGWIAANMRSPFAGFLAALILLGPLAFRRKERVSRG